MVAPVGSVVHEEETPEVQIALNPGGREVQKKDVVVFEFHGREEKVVMTSDNFFGVGAAIEPDTFNVILDPPDTKQATH